MKYKVLFEYRGRVTIEVYAESEEVAKKVALSEADEAILYNLEVYDSKVVLLQ